MRDVFRGSQTDEVNLSSNAHHRVQFGSRAHPLFDHHHHEHFSFRQSPLRTRLLSALCSSGTLIQQGRQSSCCFRPCARAGRAFTQLSPEKDEIDEESVQKKRWRGGRKENSTQFMQPYWPKDRVRLRPASYTPSLPTRLYTPPRNSIFPGTLAANMSGAELGWPERTSGNSSGSHSAPSMILLAVHWFSSIASPPGVPLFAAASARFRTVLHFWRGGRG
ncbi:hypothetical protein PENSPDRAFT_672211 [Peniophora sp. CONT]|nr:hypothetical protein PENSPDRAFT_672211 [Peniophora sp. CONT]